MKDSEVKVLLEPKLSMADQFYLPQVLIGLGTTFKHMFRVVALGKDRVVQYPEERRDDGKMKVEDGGMNRATYKGVHRLNKDEEGRVKCVACFMCSTACPARCIHIEAAEDPPGPTGKKCPAKFRHLRRIAACIYCGMCEEACPVDAIEMTSVYDIVCLTRQEMIFDKSKLLRIYDQTAKDEPMWEVDLLWKCTVWL